MTNQPCRLDQNRQVVILIQHIQGNIFRLRHVRLGAGASRVILSLGRVRYPVFTLWPLPESAHSGSIAVSVTGFHRDHSGQILIQTDSGSFGGTIQIAILSLKSLGLILLKADQTIY